ncbi:MULTISPECIES: GTP-binding protein [Clostridium]|uniref:CobW-like protein with a nucleotide-binding domain n=3 Tax=Clostridium TaxID=1485 RepID=D8GJG5_CLOLD|nr:MULTISPECIES: GTP-binding protein [Clostridium]ADK15126.1 CobW-like protein with a nucleotide-binding domain [Clostridium ljungdahlii DSM 13528]AGY74382.1 cobalamin biosynthesis protein P47K [Clostridium autoethanogenum DSM 10061]ALU34571.1 Cobalamin synthesis protein P47K [Clostridium autoethanogenum DSM 10061]OAA82817.1 putative metal chaperone YciC [Clostridium ljungdahlii DSM 13528]OVY51291.1 putative metal chaperone YciC [Clostridium autoethanogenum]
MNLIIFGGFLGSGKTSLILSLAHFLVEKQSPNKQNLVIIENEVGETGIDDKVLKSKGLSVKELFSGCICCQLSSDLVITLNDLREKVDPEWVIIETTGLAYPSKILSTLNKYGKGIESIRIVSVVDAERFEELTEIAPVLIKSQISDGNTILVNKIDLVTDKQLKNIERSVKEVNPKATLYKVSANKDINDSIWKEVAKSNE